MRQKISETVDRMLLFLVSGFFSIAAAGYFSRDPAIILTAGLCGALSVTALTGFLRGRRKPGADAREFADNMLQFYLKGAPFGYEAVFRALERYRPEKRSGYILAARTAVYPEFSPEPLTLARLFEIYAETAVGDGLRYVLVLTLSGAAPEALKTAPMLPGVPVSVLSGVRTCRFLQFFGALPAVTLTLKREKRSFRKFFALALSSAACKRYMLAALLLIGSSFIMPSSVYYLAAAAFLIALTILAKLNVGRKFASE